MGKTCTIMKLSISDIISLLAEVLGVNIDVAKDQLSQKGLYVKLSWLMSLFITFGDKHEDQVIRIFFVIFVRLYNIC